MMTSDQVCKVDHLLEDDLFSLEAKALLYGSLTAEVRVEISRNEICNTIRAALGYGKCLACVKR